MKTTIRIVLVDDHAVLRAGLKALLNAESDMLVVGEAGDGISCLNTIKEKQPDVVLLDINMPGSNGLEILKRLHREKSKVRILILTMHDDITYVKEVLAFGGSGYVLKEAADNQLLTAIRTVYHGGVYLHLAHTRALVEKNGTKAQPLTEPENLLNKLSLREREVLRLVAFGHSNKEIAEMLCIGVKSVETYKARVMEKLGFKTRTSLVRFALELGLLSENKAKTAL